LQHQHSSRNQGGSQATVWIGEQGVQWARRSLVGVTLGAALCATPPSAKAAPATLTLYPSTDIYRRGNVHLDSDIVTGSFRNTTFASAGLNYGLGPDRDGLFGRSDIGIEYLPAPLTGVSPRNRLAFNVKTQIYNKVDTTGPTVTRLVMGLRAFGSRGNPGTGNSTAPKDVLYLVGSRTFGFGRIHVGLAHSLATRAFLATPAGNAARTYLQLGYDKQIARNFRFAVDFYSGKSSLSALAPSIVWYVDNKASFQLGYFRYNDASVQPRDQIYGAFNYDFGADPYDSPLSAIDNAPADGPPPAATAPVTAPTTVPAP